MLIPLDRADVRTVVAHLPGPVRQLLSGPEKTTGLVEEDRVFLAGGFIRAVIAGEEPSDIDLFGNSRRAIVRTEERLEKHYTAHPPLRTQNATTFRPGLSPRPEPPVQVVTRWAYETPEDLVIGFDFTVARAVVWWDTGGWRGLADDRFYRDLAARRLRYACPERDEEAGGSLLRALKFVRRGYRLPAADLAQLIVRVNVAARDGLSEEDVLTVLREVDPDPFAADEGGILVAPEWRPPAPSDGEPF